MKKILILLGLLLLPTLAEAQTSRNPCYTTGPQGNTGLPNCIPVGTYTSTSGWGPLPVGGLATAAAPTFLEGKEGGLSFDLSGNLRVSSGGGGAVTIADGADVAEGAIADAASTAGGTGTVSAKLRLITSQIPLTQAPVAPATATATKSELIGAQATTAAVNPTNGQQSALSSDTNNNLLVSSGGAPNLSIAQVSIDTSDTSAVAARALRRSVTIQNITGTQNVFCNQTTATAANGVLLPAVVGASITLDTTSAVRCIAITSAQTVAIVETY